MGKDSKIEWCDATFNPWWGCEKVKGSPACARCYAETWAKRVGHNIWGANAPRRFFGPSHWEQPLRWNRRAEASGKPFRVFCASMGDVLEDRRDLDAARHMLWNLIEMTPALTWLLLTKRPENFDKLAPGPWVTRRCPPNLHWGVTAEDQPHWDLRVSALSRIPCDTTFVSCEPLRGRIIPAPLYGVKQIIGGGETGHGAEPMHPDWARGLRDACINAGIAFFFKQWGEWTPGVNVERRTGWVKTATRMDDRWLFGSEDLATDDNHVDDEPDLYRVGKKEAGRLLDGVIWDQFPETKREAATA
jgi:protein gp37